MASVNINVTIGRTDYTVSLEHPEQNRQLWGSDRGYVDTLVDEAVARIKRAYNNSDDSETHVNQT